MVILLTGASSGIGAATARVLCEQGHKVYGTYRKNPPKDPCFTPVYMDVQDEDSVRAAIEKVIAEEGRLDALVNNAGVDMTLPVDELAADDWDRIIRVNLRGPFLTSKYVLPAMKERKSGHIVNVASTAAKRAWANASAYHASKWGLLGFSHALHVEARPHNVKVTAIVTGGMRTPFLLDRFPDIDLKNLQDPRNVAETIKFVLLQPAETVIPEVMVLPMRETSWP